MKIKWLFITLWCTALPLCGFTWGFGVDKCKQAMELAGSLDTIRDEGELRQTETKILNLCPDGASAHYVMALQFERAGNLDGALIEYRRTLQLEQTFPRASGNLGMIYFQKGMFDEASIELTRGLEGVPKPVYHKAMGRILSDRKVYPLALYHFGEAAKELSRDAEVFTGMAQIHVAMGQPDKALQEYRRALTANPSYEKASLGMASLFLARNDLDSALEELKKAEIANPQSRDIHMMKAGIYEKKGDSKQAEYEYLLGGKQKAAAAAQKALDTALASIDELAARGENAKAVEALQVLIKEKPDRPELQEKLGNLYRSMDKNLEAITAYREAAHLNTSSSGVYLNLGILYEKRAMLDEAVVAYKQAILLKAGNADARLRLADIYLARGSQSQAVEQYGEFLKLKPESPDIQLKLGRIFAKNKEFNLALDAYLAVLKQSPDNLDANREIAAIYRSKGSDEQAIEHYKKVLAQQKSDLDTRNALVSLYVKNKQYDEITELLKGTVELSPDDPNNHYKLGLIFDFKKDYDNAIASYKKAIELKPDHSRALNALGKLYMKTGKLSEAREALEAAKKADPTMQETTVLLNNIRDEFNPEPRKISKYKKSKSKKKKGAKQVKSSSKAGKTDKKAASKDKGTTKKQP